MKKRKIASRAKWTEARKALLAREKELTRLQDEIAAARRELPWERIEKTYMFRTSDGDRTLSGLFGGRSQLFLYHFMYGPDSQQGCLGCSFFCDHIDGANQHLAHHDVKIVAVARAPLAKLLAYRQRMGWKFDFVSSEGSDFNYDFNVSFREDDLAKGPVTYNYAPLETKMQDLPGVSIFFKDTDSALYHTYSSFGRGDDHIIGAYAMLDMMPLGRNETGPNFNLTDWVRRHDEYGTEQQSDAA
jgi:predicted dithiol-disulfide oxidoreductase (DUF899 family)